jgi:hypothetical protein
MAGFALSSAGRSLEEATTLGFLLGIGQPLTMDTRGTALAIRLTGNRFG